MIFKQKYLEFFNQWTKTHEINSLNYYTLASQCHNIIIDIEFTSLSFIKLTKMKGALKRCKSSHLHIELEKPKLFQRNRDEPLEESFYREGVQEIIKQRKFLELTHDTVFMAINFYKEYLNSGGAFSKNNIISIYMACVSLASKFNDVRPPTLEQIAEAQDNFIDIKSIIKMEARILKHFKYFLPYESNLILELEAILGVQNKQNIAQCVKTLYSHIYDPIFMKAQNEEIAGAIVLFHNPKHEIKEKVTKMIEMLIHRVRQRINKKKIMVNRELTQRIN